MYPDIERNESSRRQLIHIEDEFSWRMIVKTSVEAVGNFELTQFDALEEDALKEIKRLRSKDVVIFDLALPNNQETQKTVAEILHNAPDLLQRGINIFVYSAYYTQWKDKLESYGISEKYLFSKGTSFDREKLENTLKELSSDSTESQSPVGDTFCDVLVYLGDKSNSLEIPEISSGTPKNLTVEIIGTMTEEESVFFSGKHIRVNVISESGMIHGELGWAHSHSHVLTIPKPNHAYRITFEVEFSLESVHKIEPILVLLYHNNHLMLKLTQFVKVT